MNDPVSPAWSFPPVESLPNDDLVALGADLSPTTLIAAYRQGFFPMPLTLPLSEVLKARKRTEIGWFHPLERAVFLPGDLHVSRSLRKSLRRFTTTVDAAFDQVIAACGDPSRPHGWIDDQIVEAYSRLHALGIAHSVEVWDDQGLAGGLYGAAINGLFAGESMFHARTDASKVAMKALADLVGDESGRLIDVQWPTDHLRRMGCRTIQRTEYAERLDLAMEHELTVVFRRNE